MQVGHDGAVGPWGIRGNLQPCDAMLKGALTLLLYSSCSADYRKDSTWPNAQCSGVPSMETFFNVGEDGCVSWGDHSERTLCTNSSYGEQRQYSSNDCTGIYTNAPIVLDSSCSPTGDFFGQSSRSVCVSTGASPLVAPSAAAPNTVLYKSYLVDSCTRLSSKTLDFFIVLSTGVCVPLSTQVSSAIFCNATGLYRGDFGPGCTGPPIAAFRGWELGCGPDEERNRYFVADVSCYSAPQAQQTSKVSAAVLGGAVGGTVLGLGLLVGGVLLWRRGQSASAPEKAPLIFLSK